MKANFDTTYCINKECNNKCIRHQDNYEFDDSKNYWFQEYCLEFLEKKGDKIKC